MVLSSADHCSLNGAAHLIRMDDEEHIISEPLSADVKHDVEKYWMDKINPRDESSTAVPSNNKCYVLSMFPYPSGKLHMGHVRVYTISDVLARFFRMQGFKVIHPIGWDAFGLPAENAAILNNLSPEDWTKSNIAYMKQQLVKLGISFDWQREIATCSPDYYRWTQYIFLKLYEKGYLYRKEALVNWDPVDHTVLAEEQVDENGCSWRSGAKVVKKPLKQWFVKTTRLAQSLSEGLNDPSLKDWDDVIKMQQNWIGECNGYKFELPLADDPSSWVGIWTNRPESLKSASFVALKSSHILNKPEYRDPSSPLLKTKIRNPLNGHLLPVILVDGDEMDYPENCDSVIGDPSTDSKASHLAHKYSLSSAPQLEPKDDLSAKEISQKALSENWGGYKTSSKLGDWLISRQRYWGTPIPIIECQQGCGMQPVPLDQLPVELPGSSDAVRGHSALLHNQQFVNVNCPKCGGPAKRETDTMDTFVDSTWYFLRYLDPRNSELPFDPQRAKAGMPVDIYIGGKEHAVLHLFFARFVCHFLHILGLVPHPEPFRRLLVQGMVMGRSYRVKGSGKYLKPEEIDFSGPKPLEMSTKKPLVVSWEKMSKSKFNGIEPESVWNEHGIDTTRLLVLADVSPRSARNWSKDTYAGILNWQNRLWAVMKDWIEHRRKGSAAKTVLSDDQERIWWNARNTAVQSVSFSLQHAQLFSLAIVKMQALTNNLKKVPKDYNVGASREYERGLGALIVMLAPLAPHFASELWAAFVDNASKESATSDFDFSKPVVEQKWPQVDMDYSLDLKCVVNHQDCGASIKMPRHQLDRLDEATALQLLKQNETFIKHHGSSPILNVTFDHYPGLSATITLVTDRVQQKKSEVS